jgi:4-aminobutyrate aminotransferase/(S)-3-amino-2-methylpropionate transaminase
MSTVPETVKRKGALTPARRREHAQMNGSSLPIRQTEIPGPASRSWVDRLAMHECPAVTARRARRAAQLGAADDDPIVWAEAQGTNVVDVDGNVYIDWLAGFGVAFVGHRHPEVVAAARAQEDRLLHAMGDAWADTTRITLLEALADIAPEGLTVGILGLSGSDAIDAAVKTAVLATGRPGVVAFGGGYHGLALGVLGLQGYKASFTDPFREIAHPQVTHLDYGGELAHLDEALAGGTVGLVLVEPILGRGGMTPAPEGWLAGVAEVARRRGAVLAFDEVQSGLGRTGQWFASAHDGVVPDLVCVGKALGGGYPLSACLGSRAVMDHWGASKGESLHTQTFLGHPVGCAAGLAVLGLIRREGLLAKAHERGERIDRALAHRGFTTRGRGLMRAVPIGPDAYPVCKALLQRGHLVLPAGRSGDALGLTPPVSLTDAQIERFADDVAESVAEVRR